VKADIKQQWIDALQSGEYQQGSGQLRTVNNEYCWLGVLCDLAVQAGIAKWEKHPTGSWRAVSLDGTKRSLNYLPSFVMKWAELEFDNPNIQYFHEAEDVHTRTLAGANDTGAPFSRIAKIIEEQL
jgi:hypothetical protein